MEKEEGHARWRQGHEHKLRRTLSQEGLYVGPEGNRTTMLSLADWLQSWPDADGAFLGLQNRLNGSESVLLGVHPPWAKKASAGLVCC